MCIRDRLKPANGNEFKTLGSELYLKREGQIYNGKDLYNGKGLLLGKNSPFKDIPILGMLL